MSRTQALAHCLFNRLAGMWTGLAAGILLWLVHHHAAAVPTTAFQPLQLTPLVLSGLLLDAGRWRMRWRLNRARHQAYQQLNRRSIDHQVRLVQDLLTIRRLAMEASSLNEASQRLLDELIVAHHRHLSNLQRGVGDSDLMAPLHTGAYVDDTGHSTWSASLQRELTARDHWR